MQQQSILVFQNEENLTEVCKQTYYSWFPKPVFYQKTVFNCLVDLGSVHKCLKTNKIKFL